MAGQGLARRRLVTTVVASLGAAFVLGVAAAVIAELAKLKPELAVFSLIAISLAVVAVMALMLWLCARWWRVADEAAREAHKWSWYWGGSTGLAAAAVPFILLHTMPRTVEPLLPSDMSTAQAVLLGMGLLGGCQLVGYGLFWAGWWLARR
ncbi:hypothetical protein CFHF_02135 [Caulobacter flavus]|uniref:Uncharacterized protein n=1 Tax=Caulobacter flavus TaxID=1679497 RepID=A0A2N5D3A6_9CAUL|nr:hypothetical protein [Caulobacter flavus]AYV48981.1 hypothetical protein C1707_23490 [Caulobacter flavus]PLR20549.1 hypothetical protein CFHF_02135 [Caulobacter flavus]